MRRRWMGAFDPPFFAIMKAKWALLSRSGRKKHHFLSLASGNFVKILSQTFRERDNSQARNFGTCRSRYHAPEDLLWIKSKPRPKLRSRVASSISAGLRGPQQQNPARTRWLLPHSRSHRTELL